MTQYNFGTIDPYVVDGVQLAGMLNQWRDAIHSWHRGSARPSYVVPGMMWIDDSGGATNWVVKVFISVALGDKPLFTYNTTSGVISIVVGTGSSMTAETLLAQGAANPAVAFWATSNPIDAKRWQFSVNAAGALVLSSLNDAGAVQNSLTFNRDGTLLSQPAARFHVAANFAYGPSGALVVAWDTPDFNFNAGTMAAGKWTPGAGLWYFATGFYAVATSQNNTGWNLIRRNAAGVVQGHSAQWAGFIWGSSVATGAQVGSMFQMNATDTISVEYSAGGTGTATFQGNATWLEGWKVR
jgi:hypothetical protein